MTGEGRGLREPTPGRPGYAAEYLPAPSPLNQRPVPSTVSVRPQGHIYCIVRLEWDGWDEMVPGWAIRWTDTLVLVMIPPPGAPSSTRELLLWVDADDVYRTIPRRPVPWRGPDGAEQHDGPPSVRDDA
ncbi:hypothetical protein [Xylanimonas protaetiae]|uniref:hypothetical protein n=1 Tax=Xylanimonas protaetiae TaxID=2509457 RepID=UPI001A917CCB|nr:hypothetical protein [Xylanimonas protaetiae]